MSKLAGRLGRLFTIVASVVLVSCGSGGDGDNPCGLTPSGSLTDGRFSGSMRFTGVAKEFPLSVDLDAAARVLAGDVSFQDAVQDYEGTFSAAVTVDGKVGGSYSADGTSTGSRITGSVSGVTDNQRACGVWENTAGQRGTWDLARVAP